MKHPATARSNIWRRMTGIVVPVLAAGLLLHSPAQALEKNRGKDRSPVPETAIREPPRQMAAVSEDRIIEEVERRYKAKVVRKDKSEVNGRRVLVLKLDDGRRVWTVRVDAETGSTL